MTTATLADNGVNVQQLLDTIEQVKNDPEVGLFKFRADSKWVKGGNCQTKIKEFYGAKQEDTSRLKPFVLESDEPPILMGNNKGPNAVELVLQALASCLTVGFVYNASAQGINVESLEFVTEGDIDLQGFLGVSKNVRPGYQNINLKYKVKADASEEKLNELWEYVKQTSPVLDILRNPIKVSISPN